MTWVQIDEKQTSEFLERRFCGEEGLEGTQIWIRVVAWVLDDERWLGVEVFHRFGENEAIYTAQSWPTNLLPEIMAIVVKAQRVFKIETLRGGVPAPTGSFGDRDLVQVVDSDDTDTRPPLVEGYSAISDDILLGRIVAAMQSHIRFGAYLAVAGVRERSSGQIVIYPEGTGWDEDEYVLVSVEYQERWTRQERAFRQTLLRETHHNPTHLDSIWFNQRITRFVLQVLHTRQDQNEAGAS